MFDLTVKLTPGQLMNMHAVMTPLPSPDYNVEFLVSIALVLFHTAHNHYKYSNVGSKMSVHCNPVQYHRDKSVSN